MRLYHQHHRLNHTNKHGNNRPPPSSSRRHLLKWVSIFALLSLYLLLFLISSSSTRTSSPLSPLSLSLSTSLSSSHALFDSPSLPTTTSSSSSSSSNLDFAAIGLKMYVYDLPSKYNTDWLAADARCGTHLFASEVAIHKALLSNNKIRTLDPYSADLFFVPVYVSCNFSTTNGFPAIGHARELITSAVHLVSSTLPFWNRSGGSDHIFVASHDFGACFHTMEDAAIRDGVVEVLRGSIVLQTFGVEGKKKHHPCVDQVRNAVVIPPYVSPETVRETVEREKGKKGKRKRDIFVFFRGKMEVHPKNVSGRFYSKTVRTKIWRKFNSDPRFYLRRHRFAGYQSEILRSKFCLCPLGWAPWSPRLVESVVLGCVPVIIADGIRLPFHDAVPWPEISVTVAERDVEDLGRILEEVERTNLTRIQARLEEDEGIRRALLFNDPMVVGDATWQVLRRLRRIVERSRRSQ